MNIRIMKQLLIQLPAAKMRTDALAALFADDDVHHQLIPLQFLLLQPCFAKHNFDQIDLDRDFAIGTWRCWWYGL